MQTIQVNRNGGTTHTIPNGEASEHTPIEVRTIPMTLFIILGGMADFARRLKAKKPPAEGGLWAFLVIDSDPRSQEPQGELPGFDESEFVYLPRMAVRNVLRRPEHHDVLSARLGLSDNKTRSVLASLAERITNAAGQVRPLGLLTLLVNWSNVKSRIHRAIKELQDKWINLSKRLSASGRIQYQVQGLEIVIVFSSYGGTGSSSFEDLAIEIRRYLEDQEFQVTGLMTTPDCYEEKMQGKPEEWERLKANGFSTFRELNYFQSGRAFQDGLRVGDGNERVPPTLFDQLQIVQRADSDGKCIGGFEDVLDMMALHYSALVGTELGAKVRTIEGNDPYLTGLHHCPITREKRSYSTIGATALCLPKTRLVKHLAYRMALEWLTNQLLGSGQGADQTTSEVDRWLMAVQAEERASAVQDSLTNRLRLSAITNLDNLPRQLYASMDRSIPEYLPNKSFVAAFERLVQHWQTSELPTIRKKLTEQVAPVQTELVKSLRQHTSQVADGRGMRCAQEFLIQLTKALTTAIQDLNESVRSEIRRTGLEVERSTQLMQRLTGFLKRFCRNSAAQEEVILHLRARLKSDSEAAAKREAAAILSFVNQEVDRLCTHVTQVIEAMEAIMAEFTAPATEYLAGQDSADTAVTSGEISVVTREFIDRFYQTHRAPLSAGFFANDATPVSASAILDGLTGLDLRESLVSIALRHFQAKLDELTISDVLRQQLIQGGECAQITRAKFQEAVQACRPSWQAEIGVAGLQFSDNIWIGVPEDFLPLLTEHFGDVLDECQAALNRDARYQAKINIESTVDRDRIYVIRRVHGGAPHYLAGWKDWTRSYEDWTKSGAHPTHIFDAKTLEDIPLLRIQNSETDAELMFALALAYGWVANRGSWYYINIIRSGTESAYEVPINSHSDCIPFCNGQLRENVGGLQTLVQHGILKFAQGRSPDKALKLGEQGRASALCDFQRSEKSIRLVNEIYKQLKGDVGDIFVAQDLQRYLEDLSNRNRSADEVLESQMQRETLLLKREIERLRARK
jgi:hypothetical protein